MDPVDWLLESSEPAVRDLARTQLGDEAATEDVVSGPIVRALLDHDVDEHPYSKWTGAHWRLVSLVELGVPADEPRLDRMIERELGWLTDPGHRGRSAKLIDGRWRRCASQEGNAVAVCARLGWADDERVRLLVESLLEWQWPDGGWNCDKRPAATHSSFHESHSPIWGLHEYAVATGDADAAGAARRGAELLLSRQVYRRRRDGEPVHPSWSVLHHPVYWHYDVLQGLVVLTRLGLVRDARCAAALDHLEARRLRDGRWRPGAYWWRRPGSARSADVVDWGRGGPNEHLTLKALTVLRAAGR